MNISRKFLSMILFCSMFICLSISATVILFKAGSITFLTSNFIIVLTVLLCGGCVYFYIINKSVISRILFIVCLTLSFAIFMYAISVKYNLLKLLTNATQIKNFILDQGGWGVLALITIQVAQSVAVPIPSVIIVFVGTLIYGPLLCAVFCSVGILMGSYISFALGKVFGRKLVAWMIGADKLEYYSLLVQGRERLFLIFAFILPFFPDDLLCLTAGITKMTFKEFFFVALFTRPIGMLFLCFFGGSIFDFKSNYMFFLVVIIFGVLALIYLSIFKKQREFLFSESKKLIKSFSVK